MYLFVYFAGMMTKGGLCKIIYFTLIFRIFAMITFSEMIVQDCQTIKPTLPIFYEKWEQNSIKKASYWQLPFPPERRPLTRPMTFLSWARLWTLSTSWPTISMDGESHLFRFFRVVEVNISLWNAKRPNFKSCH